MAQTLIALFAAHVLADFALQSKAMVRAKTKPHVLALHTLIVVAATLVVLGDAPGIGGLPWAALAALAVSHAVFDFAKAWRATRASTPLLDFALDQAAHAAVIVGVAATWPTLFADGFWASDAVAEVSRGAVTGDRAAAALALAAGFWVCVRVGDFVLQMLMARFKPVAPTSADAGLPNGGAYIGVLERGLIFGFVMVGQFTAIGFLIAAKSVLRFQAVRERAASEYVIIGTMASFGWAIAAALLTLWGLEVAAR